MNKSNSVTIEQIERFFDSRCTKEEAEQVAQYLRQNPEVLNQYILRDWAAADTGQALPKGYSRDMFREISEQVKTTKVIPMRRMIVGVAAAILLLITGVWLLWQGKTQPAATPMVSAANPTSKTSMPVNPRLQVRVNKSNHEERFLLPDSSTVSLYANSTLRYPEPFDNKQRALSLEGKALFAVAKDQARPFIVTAGLVETTVLGTEFSVQEEQGRINVKLYSGRVRLHASDPRWRKDILLTPGEQLDYAARGEDVVVSRWGTQREEENMETPEEPVEEKELVFDNEPLPQVMDKLANCYRLKISYDKHHIGNMYFTGTVLTSDSLTTILHVIANMNELKVVPNKRGYTLRRPIP